MGLFDDLGHAADAVGHSIGQAADAVGHVAEKGAKAAVEAIGEVSGTGSTMRGLTNEMVSMAADKQGDQRRAELGQRSAGLKDQNSTGFDPAAITSRTNWRGLGHKGIYEMLQKSVNPGPINESGTAMSDLGKGIAQDHDTFQRELSDATKSGWRGDAATKASDASAQVVTWGRDMGTALDLTGTQIQLASAAAQQAKGSVQPPLPATGFVDTFLGAGKQLITGHVGQAWDVMNASSTAKAHQETAVRVMEAVYTPTFVQADSTTPTFAHPVDPTAPAPTDQPPPGQVNPPPGHVPPPGGPMGRGYQPAGLRSSAPPPPSGYVPPPGLNPQPPGFNPQPPQPWPDRYPQDGRPIPVPPQRPIGTDLEGYQPGPPGGQPPEWRYEGGPYGGGQHGGQSGGGYGSVPFGPLGSGGGVGGAGGGAGGRYGAAGGQGGQSSLGPGGRAGLGGPGGSGEMGARGGGMGGAGARGATGAGGMPMGGGAGRGRGEEDGEHRSASYLVNADNGNEIVGDLGKVAPPVIGEG